MKRRVKDGVTREQASNKRNGEEDTKVKDRRFGISTTLKYAKLTVPTTIHTKL